MQRRVRTQPRLERAGRADRHTARRCSGCGASRAGTPSSKTCCGSTAERQPHLALRCSPASRRSRPSTAASRRRSELLDGVARRRAVRGRQRPDGPAARGAARRRPRSPPDTRTAARGGRPVLLDASRARSGCSRPGTSASARSTGPAATSPGPSAVSTRPIEYYEQAIDIEECDRRPDLRQPLTARAGARARRARRRRVTGSGSRPSRRPSCGSPRSSARRWSRPKPLGPSSPERRDPLLRCAVVAPLPRWRLQPSARIPQGSVLTMRRHHRTHPKGQST